MVEQPKTDALKTDDRVGWTMSVLRAAEKGRTRVTLLCAQAYPHFWQLVNLSDLNTHNNRSLSKVQDHLISLTRAAILEELMDIQADEGREGPFRQETRRGRVNTRMRTRKPGCFCVIAALHCRNGSIYWRLYARRRLG